MDILSFRLTFLASVFLAAAIGAETGPSRGNGTPSPPYSSEINVDSKIGYSVDLRNDRSSAVIDSLKLSLESDRVDSDARRLVVNAYQTLARQNSRSIPITMEPALN